MPPSSRPTASTTCAGRRRASVARAAAMPTTSAPSSDAGVAVAFGTDWFVEPLDPRLGPLRRRHPRVPDGGPPGGWFPEEKITLEEAIDLYTRGSAYAEFAEAQEREIDGASSPTSCSCRTISSPLRHARSSTRARANHCRRPDRLPKRSAEPAPSRIPDERPGPVIFRTHSEIEADVVRGLLETHGIQSIVTSDTLARRLPVHAERSWEVRIAVHAEDRRQAPRIIESHRDEVEHGAGRAVRLRARAARAAHRLPLQRSRAARARADAPVARRTRTPAAAWSTTSRSSSSATRCSASSIADMLFRAVPAAQRRAEVEGQGVARLGGVAGAAGRAARARRLPDPRARRREDRRPPQAGADCRRLRGADRRDLSRWRHRAGASVHRARSSTTLIDEARRTGADATFTDDYKSALQEWLQSHGRGAAGLPARRRDRPGPPASVSTSRSSSAGMLARGEGREQEGSGAERPQARSRATS